MTRDTSMREHAAHPHAPVHDPRDTPQPRPRPADPRTGVLPGDPGRGPTVAGTDAAPQTAVGTERPPEARETPEATPGGRALRYAATALLVVMAALALAAL
ncbi:hypothetical protein DRV84_11640 [Rhodosalinus sediminis]|uniref:Uncharacterized protein n=1 Tax=Rhodosalinus sediminis TaxID=1940533 RepID=A0A3D9BPN4_9RHOB|nr:hypothetical protein [Rhodosalinus sediminis]REC55478.1 hypothetical protein DRV84_11640 [Rhodosalinus sediminis]